MPRKDTNPAVRVELETNLMVAQWLQSFLESAIPRQTTPTHVRPVLFALHAKVSAAVESAKQAREQR